METHTKLVSVGGISACTAESKADICNWFCLVVLVFGVFFLNRKEFVVLCCKMKELSRNMNIGKKQDERDWEQVLPCCCVMGKGHLQSHPICKAGSIMCNPISHYNTSHPAALYKRKPVEQPVVWQADCYGYTSARAGVDRYNTTLALRHP